ncbi:MAG: hypothetical protein A2V70_19910 [Planctomycetes bacterium RBG_13_63_9]|nr:MAG: hypothetical protein A2V70_19910 [Planctomycetes bacterium RBG_13_63_9]
MAVLSGKNGTLQIGGNEITPVSNWKLRVTGTQRAYVANDTGGWKRRAAGAKDCSGVFEVRATEDGSCPVGEGDAVALKLHVDRTGGNYCELDAFIDRIGVETDISEGGVVTLEIDFSGNGGVIRHGILACQGT